LLWLCHEEAIVRLLISAVSGFFLATCLTTLSAETDKKPTGSEAKAAAAEWLDGLGEKGLVLNQAISESGFVVTHGDSAVGRVTKFDFQQSGWWVSLAFRGELSAETPLKTLNEKFWYVTLDRLPTPGLTLPGWEVRPQTATSSVEKGVEVLHYGDGKIKLRVRTKFFALYGRDPSILVPADAPLPPGAYFQIRKEFPLDLTLEAPVMFK
jgi:hypothetical protein